MNQAVTFKQDEVSSLPFPFIMGNLRQDKRYRTNSGLIAFNSISFGRVLNLSKSGMAMHYLAQRHSETHYLTEINLIHSQQGFLLNAIPCQTVYIKDRPIAGEQSVIRQIGIEFLDLSPEQEEAIAFILEHCQKEKAPATQ